MPLLNLIIGLMLGCVFLWLVFVLVVVYLHPSDPGEPILVDENIAPRGYAIVYITDGEGGYGYNDSLSERAAQSVASDQQSLGSLGSQISPVGLGGLHPIASNETEYGRQQNRSV